MKLHGLFEKIPRGIRHLRIAFSAVAIMLVFGCVDQDSAAKNENNCPSGQVYDPETGLCVNLDESSDLDAGSTSDERGEQTNDSNPDIVPNPETNCTQNGESEDCRGDVIRETSDSETVESRTCRDSDLNQVESPKVIQNPSANYKLALKSTVQTAEVQNNSVDAHIFKSSSQSYTGFVTTFDHDDDSADISDLRDLIVGKIQQNYSDATQRSSGRQMTKYTGNKALVGGIVDLPSGPSLGKARDTILSSLTGVETSQLQHSIDSGLIGGTGSENPTLFVYETVNRPDEVAVVGTLLRFDHYTDDSAKSGIDVDDLTGGASLAPAGDSLTKDCVSYDVKERPKVDIIISMDASQSMRDEQNRLEAFASKFTNLLNVANVNWRIGVTSVDCNHIKKREYLTQRFRQLWPEGDGGGIFSGPDAPCMRGNKIPRGEGKAKNGELIGQSFTTNPVEVADRINKVDDTNSEFTFTMAAAAADRALPRRQNDEKKLRPGASLVLIGITDEEDRFFKKTLDFLPKPSAGLFGSSEQLDQSEESKLQDAVKPWTEYLLQPKLNASLFGLYWTPGEDCDSAEEIGHAISELVDETGGNGGSLCQSDITNTLTGIAEDASGIASDLRLRGTPVPQSIELIHVDRSEDSTQNMPRSRVDGFRYDSIVNRVSFAGETIPDPNDRVVIPYLRWEGSIRDCETDKDCPDAQKLKCLKGVCR